MDKAGRFIIFVLALGFVFLVTSQAVSQDKVVVIPLFDTGPPGPPGPAGVGCFGVYDGNDVFLGYFITAQSAQTWLIYNPDIPGSYQVTMECGEGGPPCMLYTNEAEWFFTSEDCTGQAYVVGNYCYFNVMYTPSEGGIYYIQNSSLPRVARNQLKSYYQRTNPGVCIPYDTVNITWMCPIKQITFPLADIELAYPISVRQIQ